MKLWLVDPVRMLTESGCSPIIIATRSELQVDVMLESPDSLVVVNPAPNEGRTGSLQIGLISLISELEGLLAGF